MGLPIKEGIFSYADYLNWPEEEKWEIINGIPYAMSPAPSRIHQEISMKLTNEIYNYLKDKNCRVYSAPFDVRLFKGNKEDEDVINVVQPDITVICDDSKLDDRGAKGSPDLIIEIVSPASISLDYVKKLNLYDEFGVREYWIVNPMNKSVFVYRAMENENFGAPSIYNENDKIKVGIFKDLIIDLDYIFKTLPIR